MHKIGKSCTNMSNAGIPSTKANSISRTFPPLFMIKIPAEGQIVEHLQEIESMYTVKILFPISSYFKNVENIM